ncbi:hypothetical protein EW145_g8655, partial [Phellinidium pouzarii]
MYPLKDIVDNTLHFLSLRAPSVGSRASSVSAFNNRAVDLDRQTADNHDDDDDDEEDEDGNTILYSSQQQQQQQQQQQLQRRRSHEPDVDADAHHDRSSGTYSYSASSTTTSASNNTSAVSGLSPTSSPALDSSSSASSKEIARLRVELKQARDKQYAVQTALREAQTQVRTKDILLEQLRERARRLESDAAEARRAADERRLELRSMEHFLTKTDRWAGSDLVQATKDINSEILQFAAAASEGFPAAAATTTRRTGPAKSGTGSTP